MKNHEEEKQAKQINVKFEFILYPLFLLEINICFALWNEEGEKHEKTMKRKCNWWIRHTNLSKKNMFI